jgi:hypothetical protein
METVLPDVEKIIIEPGTNLLPYLPLGPGGDHKGEEGPP